jgi:hypothetical protein
LLAAELPFDPRSALRAQSLLREGDEPISMVDMHAALEAAM